MIQYELQHAPGAKPERWMFFLHGILGTRKNWRSFARKWIAQRKAWGAVLVDLRLHGESRALPPPHTVQAAARDLDAIPVRASALLGHSFGGKVALEYELLKKGDLDVVFVVDSTPGARPHLAGSDHGAGAIIQALRRAPARLPKRADYMDWMIAQGIDEGIAQWLCMNVRRVGDEFEIGLDLGGIRALVDDYYALDRWAVVESPPGRARHEFILGTRGDLSEEDRARLRRSPAKVHEVEAGHWVHVDAPDALLAIVVAGT